MSKDSRFSLTRRVTYTEYYTDVKANTFEEAVEKVRDDLIYDYQELEEAQAPQLLEDLGKPTEKYVISLSLDDYVQLTGVFLGNARDELFLSGDEENEELIKKAMKIIDNNLVVESEVSK